MDILLDEPINWESVVAYVEFQGKNLRSIQFRPVAQNKIGQGQADTQDEHTITCSFRHAACQRRPQASKLTIFWSGWLICHVRSEQRLR